MKLIENAGLVNNFNFTITINNTGYALISNMLTLVKVEDSETGEVLFEGRIYDNEGGMDGDGIFYKDVSCESELAYLNDTKVRAWDIENITVSIFLQQIIDNHNSHTSSGKQFQLGTIEYNNNIACKTNFENSLDCIITFIVNVIGEGYLRVRKVDGIRYLDYLQVYAGQSDDIVVGDNIKDFKFKPDTTNVISRVIPLGKDGLTISAVNNGKDYLDNLEAVGEIGIVEGTLDLTDIEDANILKTTAQSKLAELGKPVYSLDTNILDLQKIGLKPYGFLVGTSTTIQADMINFNETFDIIKKETDLLSPQNTKITLNNKVSSWSNRQLALQRAAQILQSCITPNKNINTFSLEGIIDSLKNQITASGSYKNAQVIDGKGILLENTDETSDDYGALYLGPGIFTIASEKDSNGWRWRTFGTGKGFVADLITAGTLLANRIQGGELSSLDGSFKISLENGHFTTYADGKKAIDIFNQTVSWFDFQDTGDLTGQISSNRLLDAQGNPTGTQVLSIQVPHGTMLDLASIDEDGKSPIIRINNYATDSTRQKITMYVDDLYISPKNNPDYGMSYNDGKLKLASHIDMNGYGFENLGKMNMSTGVGQSSDGYNGWYSSDNKKLIFSHGVLTDIQDI